MLHTPRYLCSFFIPLNTVVTNLGLVHRMWFHQAGDLCIAPTPIVRAVAIQDGLPPEKIRCRLPSTAAIG
ncbi:MAG TPA: hypothetical protein VJ436_13135 [Anaerolineales bacterium]|nr:hypothetical protein [Anaerolineales bacterium]